MYPIAAARTPAAAIARGWQSVHNEDKITQVPISDGGDGFGPLMGNMLKADRLHHLSNNPLGNFTECHWWKDNKSNTAIVESAEIIGMSKFCLLYTYDADYEG